MWIVLTNLEAKLISIQQLKTHLCLPITPTLIIIISSHVISSNYPVRDIIKYCIWFQFDFIFHLFDWYLSIFHFLFIKDIKSQSFMCVCVCMCVGESVCVVWHWRMIYCNNNTDWSHELIMELIRFNASFNNAWDIVPTGRAHMSSISLIKSCQRLAAVTDAPKRV